MGSERAPPSEVKATTTLKELRKEGRKMESH